MQDSVRLISSSARFIDRSCLWIHTYPTTVKVLEFALFILGGMQLASAIVAPLAIANVMLGVGGILVSAASGFAFFALDRLVPAHHSMKKHMFTEGAYEGAKLYYEKDIPILSLDYTDPYKAGLGHGYLCASAICKIVQEMDFLERLTVKETKGENLPRTLHLIKQTLPSAYIKELEGLVEGYERWRQKHFFKPREITLDDAILFHLLPDSIHFDPSQEEDRQKQIFGCSSFIDKGVFARNMDWPIRGEYSLVMHRKYQTGSDTVGVSFPGCIGSLSEMKCNESGLTLMMNVAIGRTYEVRGAPAIFYNRMCLEQCETVGEVDWFTYTHSPLGPYHLVAADKNGGQSFHFYQGEKANSRSSRKWAENKPLHTFNFRYHPEPLQEMFNCGLRQKIFERFYKQERPLEEALALPYINNFLTTHKIVVEPKTKTLKVAFDNSYAGKEPLHDVPTHRFIKPVSYGKNFYDYLIGSPAKIFKWCVGRHLKGETSTTIHFLQRG